ncbi:MAG: Enoyl-CoA hydratase/carnithine racemase [Candidatus Alkanophagales archaeon MCA70_species_1]|nr:Enoyl-CoA hydratase/carnithine racemase [Candidatus Alkanophaga volatiphilum]
MFKNIILEKKEGVVKITINRPEARNALDIETRKELLAALDDVERDESVRVVVITGAGEKTFVSGADIKMLSEMDFRQIMEFSESPLGARRSTSVLRNSASL